MNLFDINKKKIFLAGHRGLIGSHLTDYLKDQGCKVFGFDIREGRDIRKIQDIHEILNGQVMNGGINCAAIDFPPDSSIKYQKEIWGINIDGTINFCNVLADNIKRNTGGSLINFGSLYGLVSSDERVYRGLWDKPAEYGASKAAVHQLTKYFATRFAKWNIRVNAIIPGGIFNNQNQEFINRYRDKVPMERMGRVGDICGAVHFLLSDASAYITGTEIVIDGGYTAW